MTRLVLGLDPSYTMTGWCIATADGPLMAGRVRLDSMEWRWHRVTALAQDLTHRTLSLAAGLDGAVPEMVIERAPTQYARPTASRGSTAAKGMDDRKVVRSLGEISGVFIGAWTATQFSANAAPYRASGALLIEPNDWRAWWGLTSGRRSLPRAAVKRWALGVVSSRWPAFYAQLVLAGDAGLEDACEAVVMAVGAARRPASADPMHTWAPPRGWAAAQACRLPGVPNG